MSTTPQITLNFFGESVTVQNPKSLGELRNNIANLFCFSPEDAKEILLTYNENGDKIVIENEEDLNVFLKSEIKTIDLDISQTSQIFKKNMENIKQENEKDKTDLENLLKRQEELDKLKETQLGKEKEKINKIKEQIMKLRKQKCEIRAKIMKGMHKINTEKRENFKKIIELKKKLGLPIEIPKHKPIHKMAKHKHMKKGPPHHQMNPFIFPFAFFNPMNPPKFPMKPHQKKQDMRNKAIEEWGKCLFNKTQEITAKLADTFKDFPIFNLPEKTEKNEIKAEKKEKKEVKEIHNFVKCDGCGMHPLVGKRYKCKTCPNFDYCEKCLEKNKETHKHEFMVVPPRKRPHHIHNHIRKFHKMPINKKLEKKIEKIENKENVVEKEQKEQIENKNLADKIVHYNIACDGCKAFPIIGCRYKCTICDDFDYCEECEKKFGEKHNHPFLKIYEPKMTPISLKCEKK